jgi:hypothetical protein
LPSGRSGDAAGSPGGARGRERKPFLLRLSPDLMEELRQWSSSELRSLNAHIEYLLRDALRRRAKGGSRPAGE